MTPSRSDVLEMLFSIGADVEAKTADRVKALEICARSLGLAGDPDPPPLTIIDDI